MPKFCLASTEDKRYQSFKAWEPMLFKRFNITEEHWRSRKKWDACEGAEGNMLDPASKGTAPWAPLRANNRHFARIKAPEAAHHATEAAPVRVDKWVK